MKLKYSLVLFLTSLTTIIYAQYDFVGEYHDGRALIKIGKKYGYINDSKEVVIPAQYDQAYSFWNGEAEVILNGEDFVIDTKGNKLRLGQASQYDINHKINYNIKRNSTYISMNETSSTLQNEIRKQNNDFNQWRKVGEYFVYRIYGDNLDIAYDGFGRDQPTLQFDANCDGKVDDSSMDIQEGRYNSYNRYPSWGAQKQTFAKFMEFSDNGTTKYFTRYHLPSIAQCEKDYLLARYLYKDGYSLKPGGDFQIDLPVGFGNRVKEGRINLKNQQEAEINRKEQEAIAEGNRRLAASKSWDEGTKLCLTGTSLWVFDFTVQAFVEKWNQTKTKFQVRLVDCGNGNDYVMIDNVKTYKNSIIWIDPKQYNWNECR